LKSAYAKIYNIRKSLKKKLKFNEKKMAKYDALKENLYNFYTANKHLSRKEIFDRFIAIGALERSLNRWLCNLEQNKTLKRKK